MATQGRTDTDKETIVKVVFSKHDQFPNDSERSLFTKSANEVGKAPVKTLSQPTIKKLIPRADRMTPPIGDERPTHHVNPIVRGSPYQQPRASFGYHPQSPAFFPGATPPYQTCYQQNGTVYYPQPQQRSPPPVFGPQASMTPPPVFVPQPGITSPYVESATSSPYFGTFYSPCPWAFTPSPVIMPGPVSPMIVPGPISPMLIANQVETFTSDILPMMLPLGENENNKSSTSTNHSENEIEFQKSLCAEPEIVIDQSQSENQPENETKSQSESQSESHSEGHSEGQIDSVITQSQSKDDSTVSEVARSTSKSESESGKERRVTHKMSNIQSKSGRLEYLNELLGRPAKVRNPIYPKDYHLIYEYVGDQYRALIRAKCSELCACAIARTCGYGSKCSHCKVMQDCAKRNGIKLPAPRDDADNYRVISQNGNTSIVSVKHKPADGSEVNDVIYQVPSTQKCWYGSSCKFYAKGECRFLH